jgi:hypothetical protein
MNHLVRAESLRRRSASCESSANATSSSNFKTCYQLLAKNYAILARLEDEYAAGNERLAMVDRGPLGRDKAAA